MNQKKPTLSISILAWSLVLALFNAGMPITGPTSLAAQTTPSSEKVQRSKRAFLPGKRLLEGKVPFAPESLREKNWQKRLAPMLAEMPEMQEIHLFGSEISGLLMGATLYFPEKVELTGDTVILANRIIFEGQNVLIRGNYNIYIFPVTEQGVLGTSLETALREQLGETTLRSTTLAEQLKMFRPRTMQDNFTFTIDVSGYTKKKR